MELQKVVIGENIRRQEVAVQYELLWLWDGDRSGTKEGECPLLEAGI
jgi:hypothetical protein